MRALAGVMVLLAPAVWLRAEIALPFRMEELRALASGAHNGTVANPRQQLVELAARSRAAGDFLSEAYAQAGLAAVAEMAGRPGEAERTLREAATARVREAEPGFSGRVSLWLARESEQTSRYDRARFWSGVAVAEFRAVADGAGTAEALLLQATNWQAGAERRRLLERALEAAREAGLPGLRWAVQAELGEALRRAGDLAGAIGNLEVAWRELEGLGSWPEAVHAGTMLARAYLGHGHRGQALRQVSRVEGMLRERELGSAAVLARLELARILAALGERARAMATLAAIEEAPLEGMDRRTLISRASLLSLAYVALGEHRAACEVLEGHLRRAGPAAPPVVYATLSAARFQLGRYAEAVEAATTAVNQSRREDSMPKLMAYRWRGRALGRMGRGEEAASDMLEVARMGKAVLNRLAPDDEWKRQFLENRQEIADDVVAVLFQAGKARQAFQVAEDFRARAFLDLLSSRDAGASPGWVAQESGEPRLVSAALGEAPPVARLAEAAAAGRTPILSYYVHQERVFAWLVDERGELHAAASEVGVARLEALIRRACQLNYKADRKAWRELYRLLIEPLKGWLPETPETPVAILPHGPLLQLPFAALLAPSGRYLVEDHALHMLPAAAFLFREGGVAGGAALLVGAPVRMGAGPDGRTPAALPESARELKRVAVLVGGPAVVLAGSEARAERVRQASAGARVLHFATHAMVDAERPFQSYLALSERERLTAGEVYQLRLGADLVVLSACRGGSGRVSADGLMGFTRAFLYAGAASVVAPLLDLPDVAAGPLIEEFYRLYRRGVSKSRALRGAQLKLLAELRAGRLTVATEAGPMVLPEQPALWAAFVLQGGA